MFRIHSKDAEKKSNVLHFKLVDKFDFGNENKMVSRYNPFYAGKRNPSIFSFIFPAHMAEISDWIYFKFWRLFSFFKFFRKIKWQLARVASIVFTPLMKCLDNFKISLPAFKSFILSRVLVVFFITLKSSVCLKEIEISRSLIDCIYKIKSFFN